MRFRLVPREDRIPELLQLLARDLPAAGDTLAQLVGADPAQRPELSELLTETAHSANATARIIRERLARAFVTTLDPADAYRLTARLADCVDEVARAGAQVVALALPALPLRLLDQAESIQRGAELVAAGVAQTRHAEKLADLTTEARRVLAEASAAHVDLVADLLSRPADPSTLTSSDILAKLAVKQVSEDLKRCCAALHEAIRTLELIALREG